MEDKENVINLEEIPIGVLLEEIIKREEVKSVEVSFFLNKTKVLDSIKNALNELECVEIEVNTLKANEDGEVDTSTINRYLEDVKDAIYEIQNEFDEYDEEVSDIEDDLEGLVKRLSEVIK